MVEQLLDIAKYILPSVVVLIATYLIVNKFLIKEIQQKQLAIFQQNSNLTLQMRLQAYERLSIFIERMHATSLIGRYYVQGASVQDLQIAMVQGIRAEYEHNLSQQIYVSHEVWQTIKTVMEQEITMLNRIGSSFEMGTPAANYIKALSDFVLNPETTLPTDIALETLNREAKKYFIFTTIIF
ncbi:MAG: hypothetical protein IPL09_12990 [Bacteroidetes bacterium]|nr:hypothetical protein [Bacteroidota bacterium]